jgi:hypothetical protein
VLHDIRRDVTHSQTDARLSGLVRARAVDDADVMQRKLTRGQHEVDGARFVDLDGNFLSA